MITKFNGFLFEGRVHKDERIKLIDDEKYLLVVPLSDKASCKYGAFTGWCTAVPNSGASIEDVGINTSTSGSKLIYLLNKKYNKDTSIANDYKWLMDEYENGETSYEDVVNFRDEHNGDIFDLSKIAFDYSGGSYNLWDFNNTNMTDEGITLYDLIDYDIDEYIIDKVKEYCEFVY